MTKSNTVILTIFLAIVLVMMGGAALLKGALYVAKHEGDTMHLMQIVFRMADGQTPHLDFMTPIGALAFWPIAMLVKAGFGIGMAIIWSQVLMALVFLPIVIWVGWSRLSPWIAGMFGLFVMVLLLALVHGEAARAVSVSMHYNRLAWAAAFVAIVAALIPPTRANTSLVDGIIIGLMAAMLALIKMTYFVSFALPVLVALFMTGQRRAAIIALIAGLVVIGGLTVFTGLDYWVAYARDLLAVAGSEIRSAPGEPLAVVTGAPAYLGGSLAVVAGVIFLRQAKIEVGGLVLLLLIPGFFYVTYQNFGNDPQWLMLLAVLLLALRDQAQDVVNGWGWNIRHAIGITAVVALSLTAPSFFNLAYSPFRHFNVDATTYTPLLPRATVHDDLLVPELRMMRVDVRTPLDGQITGLSAYKGRKDPVVFMGETIAECSLEMGLPRAIDTIVRDLEDAGLAEGRSVLVADLFSSHWMFGAFEPLEHGAPWYYGGLPGIEDADYLLVPFCAVTPDVQRQILAGVEAVEPKITVTEIRRTELYVLYTLGQ